MELNKKCFLAIFTALGIQLVCGINLANAVPCEETLKAHWDEQSFFTSEDDDTNGTYRKGDKIKEIDMSIFTPIYHATTYEMALDKFPMLAIGFVEKHGKDCKLAAVQLSNRRAMPQCIANYLIANNCDVSAFKNSGTSQQKNSRNSSSNQSSNQSSSSAQSNSPESYNIQVSQTNKQNYQAVQRAYEQANAGKGKKNNLQAVATECMKNNPSQLTYKNNCKQPINFSYCFSGITPGYKNENPETLVEMSCQNGQFGTLTLGAGESIPGSYRGMVLEGVGCKSPSQPVGMKYNTSEPANGRCSY